MDEKMRMDLLRWKQIHHLSISDCAAMAYLLWKCKEFRNLILYCHNNYPIRRRLIDPFYPPMDTLNIDTFEIGGGLYIQHGFATMIAVESIEENCWINQQLTVGYNCQGNPPVNGNNMMITCGTKVLGPIHVGNHVTVDTNAVVIRDVPDHCVVGSVPVKEIKQVRRDNWPYDN